MTSNSASPLKPYLWIWLTVFVLIAAGLLLMVWLIDESGVWLSEWDARQYYRSGISLAEGLGYVVPEYNIVEDILEWRPLTHYPPLVPTLYAVGIRVGMAPEYVPSVVDLIAWGLFLVGSALLNARVAQRTSAAVWGTMLALLTWPYWLAFQRVLSEPVFFLLLVWFAYFLSDSKHRNRVWWWAVILTLLSLLLVTRYVAIYIYAGVVLWWTLVRWRKVPYRRLIGEWFLWGLPALPLGVWLVRNYILSRHLFGPGHDTDNPLPFLGEALPELIRQSSWIIFPSMNPLAAVRALGLISVIGVGIALLAIAFTVLCNYRRWLQLWHPLQTPLPALIVAYMSVFTVFSFTLSYPIEQRYMAVTLILLQPLIIGSLVQARPDRPWLLPSSYLLLHTGLLLAVISAGLTPTWIRLGPVKTLDRSRYFSDVEAKLTAMPSETAVVSNAPGFFVDHPVVNPSLGDPIQEWLRTGTCQTQHPVLLAVVDWDRWATPAVERLNDAIQAKCPDLEPVQMQRATLYHLGPSAAVQSE